MSEKEKIEIAYKNGMSFGEEQQLYWEKEDYLEVDKDKEIERLNKELAEKEAILGGIQQLEAEIERLNNIIKKGIEAINVYQNEKTLSVRYEDLKRIRGILQGNEFDLQMFEEYSQELKGDGSNEY